jgi:hypothetical protein
MVSHYTGPILRNFHCMSHFVNHLRDFLTNPNCCCLLDSRQKGWSPKSRSHFVALSKSNQTNMFEDIERSLDSKLHLFWKHKRRFLSKELEGKKVGRIGGIVGNNLLSVFDLSVETGCFRSILKYWITACLS